MHHSSSRQHSVSRSSPGRARSTGIHRPAHKHVPQRLWALVRHRFIIVAIIGDLSLAVPLSLSHLSTRRVRSMTRRRYHVAEQISCDPRPTLARDVLGAGESETSFAGVAFQDVSVVSNIRFE
jgi:hypothetical protein